MTPLLGGHLQEMKSVFLRSAYSHPMSPRGVATLTHRAPMWEVLGNTPMEAGASLDKGLPQGWEVSTAAHSMSWILGGDRVQHQASEGQDTLPQIWHVGKINIETERIFHRAEAGSFL